MREENTGYKFVKSNKEKLSDDINMYRYKVIKPYDTIGYMKCDECDTDFVFDIEGFNDLITRINNGEDIECPECHQNMSFIMDMTLDNLAKAIKYREKRILFANTIRQIYLAIRLNNYLVYNNKVN